MQRFAQILTLVVLIIATVLPFNMMAAGPGEPQGQQRVLIEFAPGRKAAVQRAMGSDAIIHYEFDEINTMAVTLPEAALDGIRRNPNVVMVEEDAIRQPMGQTVPWGIDAVQARDVWDANRDGVVDAGAPTGAGITVCVIDSGLQIDHEDFAGVNVIGGYPSNWNADSCGHGTHVAGTIAAANNNVGVVGVSPGEVSLYIIKVFDGDNCGWSYSSTLVDAANRCANAGANVINMSLGGGRKSRTEENAFNNLNSNGILSIAAAGNDGSTSHSYPASYSSVLSVGALDSNLVIADFSQKNNQVELSAPGVAVLSTVPWDATTEVVVDGVTYQANHIENAAYGAANGGLVDGGLCTSTGNWNGKVVLCERGSISFYDKVMNVQNSGGAAAVLYNNEPGNFFGTLGTSTSNIPAVTLSQADGQYLVANKINQNAGVTAQNVKPASGYEAWNGTSMATPHVAGVAAVLWSFNPSLSNNDIRNAMNTTALDLGPEGRDNAYGYGLVQTYDAWVALGGGGSTPPVNNPPVASFSFACDELACDFDASASYDSDGSIVSYAWNFGDGNTGSGEFASHAYAEDGTYNVTLTVTDNEGATDSDSKNVSVALNDGGGDDGGDDGGDEDTTPPVISNVTVYNSNPVNIVIAWTTDEPATSEVIINGQYFVSNALVTNHSMGFRVSRNTTYTFYVQSTDAAGNTAIAGPFTHNN